MKKEYCDICKNKFKSILDIHNAAPLYKDKWCCSNCNMQVIKARINELKGK